MPCDSIFAAPRSVLRHLAALPQRPGQSRCISAAPWLPPDRPAVLPPNLPWGKNPARRGARGIPGRGENFKHPGGGLQGTPQARA